MNAANATGISTGKTAIKIMKIIIAIIIKLAEIAANIFLEFFALYLVKRFLVVA